MRGVHGQRFRTGLLPDRAARGGIPRGDNSGHANRQEPTVRKHWGGLRAGVVAGGGAVHCEGRLIPESPELAAGRGVVCAHTFIGAAPRKDVHAITHNDWARITFSDFHLPLLNQRIRPGRRSSEGCGSAVAGWPAPLCPVRVGLLGDNHDRRDRRHQESRRSRTPQCVHKDLEQIRHEDCWSTL